MEVKKGLRVRNTINGDLGSCTGKKIDGMVGNINKLIEVEWDSGKPRKTAVNSNILEVINNG